MSELIVARGLGKSFGTTRALDDVSFRVESGRIVGLIGPNGAGKTTALKAILGLTPYEGELRVLGRNPYLERNAVMQEVCFIADVAVLPPWLKVSNALDFVAGVHPRFDRAKAEALRSVIRRLLQPPVVEHQRFGLPIFQEQFAIVGPRKPPRQFAADGIAVKIGAVEQGGCGGIGHAGSDKNVAVVPAKAGTHNHRPS